MVSRNPKRSRGTPMSKPGPADREIGSPLPLQKSQARSDKSDRENDDESDSDIVMLDNGDLTPSEDSTIETPLAKGNELMQDAEPDVPPQSTGASTIPMDEEVSPDPRHEVDENISLNGYERTPSGRPYTMFYSGPLPISPIAKFVLRIVRRLRGSLANTCCAHPRWLQEIRSRRL